MHCKVFCVFPPVVILAMKLDEALAQLDAISAVADRATTFQGLRAFPTALSAVLGLAAASIQNRWLAGSEDPTTKFVTLWVGVAAIALVVVFADMVLRYHRDPTARARRMTIEVLARLAPSITVGAALTVIVLLTAHEVAWMLPGLWSILLGLGIFAASSLLPRSLQRVGIWYVGCGMAVMIVAQGVNQLHPLAMAVPFGCGQLLAAWLMQRECNQHPTAEEKG